MEEGGAPRPRPCAASVLFKGESLVRRTIRAASPGLRTGPKSLDGTVQCRIDESVRYAFWERRARGIGKQLGSEEFLITGDLPDIEGKARSEKMVDI